MTHVDDTNIALVGKQLEKHEGFVPYAYRDTQGLWTIGYGTLIDKNGGHITRKEGAYLRDNRIKSKIAQLDLYLSWWRNLSPARQRAMMNWAYQIGVGGIQGFTKALAAIQAEDWETAKAEMLDSLWHEQTPTRAEELAEVMLTGEELSYL